MRPRGQGQGSNRSADILVAIVLGVGAWGVPTPVAFAHCRDGSPACPDVIIQGTTLTIMDPTHTTIITMNNQIPGVALPLPSIPPLTPLPAEALAVPRLLPTPGEPGRPGQLVDLPPPGPALHEPASPAPPQAEGPVPPVHLPAFELDRGRPAPSVPQAATPSVGLVPLDPKGMPLESVAHSEAGRPPESRKPEVPRNP